MPVEVLGIICFTLTFTRHVADPPGEGKSVAASGQVGSVLVHGVQGANLLGGKSHPDSQLANVGKKIAAIPMHQFVVGRLVGRRFDAPEFMAA